MASHCGFTSMICAGIFLVYGCIGGDYAENRSICADSANRVTTQQNRYTTAETAELTITFLKRNAPVSLSKRD